MFPRKKTSAIARMYVFGSVVITTVTVISQRISDIQAYEIVFFFNYLLLMLTYIAI